MKMKKTGEPINLAYYNRGYTQAAKDANGVNSHMRGFSDPNLFVAETTQEKVVEFKGADDDGRRFSWAIPFELLSAARGGERLNAGASHNRILFEVRLRGARVPKWKRTWRLVGFEVSSHRSR